MNFSATTRRILATAALSLLVAASPLIPQLPRGCEKRPPGDTVRVPPGTFEMGDHSGWAHYDEAPVHAVTLNGFDIDTFEVSNRKYADYLNTAYGQGRITVSGGVVSQLGGAGQALCDTTGSTGWSSITWDGTTFGVAFGREDHPMQMVSWYGACAYANQRSRDAGKTLCYDETTWDCNHGANGYRLPTEAEWEYAARGGAYSPYRTFPWGNTIDGSHANYYLSGDPYEAGSTLVGYYDGNQLPSGVDMANGFGLYDTSGGTSEWCGDWYDDIYYSSSPSDNPIGPASGAYRVVRGGSWATFLEYVRSASRNLYDPTTRWNHVGFRVLTALP